MPPIPESERAEKLGAFKRSFYEDIDRLAEGLYTGRITLGMWEEDMRTRLRIFMAGTTMIAKGDPEAVTQSDWGRVGYHMREQYRWLHRFAQDIYTRRDSITLAAIQARARLYADAANRVGTDIQAGELRQYLPYLPADGSTSCLNRCGCTWALEVVGVAPDAMTKGIRAVWTLHPEKEHCEPQGDLAGCIERDGVEVVFEVPAATEIPKAIGLGGG